MSWDLPGYRRNKVKIVCSVILALTALPGVAGPRISILGDSYSTCEDVIPPGNCSHDTVPCIDLVSIAKQKGHFSIAGMKSIDDQVTAAVRK